MIELVEIHKRFGACEVLRGVSLSIAKGEVGALLGASGSGKSTLLLAINGLESFDRGEIRVDGLTLGPDGEHPDTIFQIRRRVGMVFQQFHLFPHLSALQNVAEAPRHVLKRPRAEAEADAAAHLGRVGLGDKLHARPATLSGGQQQRVAIARALAMKPAAILFDEPTSALDPKMAAEVKDVMVELARDGQTMLVVTHSLALARAVATTVHILHEGRITESGPPQRVLEHPAQQATRELLSQATTAGEER
jgi:polar amino acid transport system ATP-binding protein